MLAASGTGAMEAAVVNTPSPGDRVIVVNGGKFGERWAKICASYGLDVDGAQGRVGPGGSIRSRRRARSRASRREGRPRAGERDVDDRAAPGRGDRASSRERRETLLVVDGITAVGVYDMPMDRWGIDVLVTGSQKALMLPPGLAFIALSERAWKRADGKHLPTFYFDLKREREEPADNTTAWTPAISLIFGLHDGAAAMLEKEGYENVFARHARLARRRAPRSRRSGSSSLAPSAPSPATTGIFVPEGVDGGKLVEYLRDKVGITFAGGQDQLKGKIVPRRAPRLHRRVRHRHRDRGARDGARDVRRACRVRHRRRRGRARS